MRGPDAASPSPPPPRAGDGRPTRCPWGLRLRLCCGYTFYYLSKGVFVAAALPLLILLLPFPRAKRRLLGTFTRRYLAWLSRGVLPGLRLYQVAEISGLDRALAARPAVFVANHRSRMDGPFLLGALPQTGVVIKAKEGRQWSFALLMRHFDFVSVDPSRISRVRTAVDQARAVLAAGRSLLVFPEGTRAASGRLQPFHSLAFQLACEAQVPVVPVVVHSVLPFMGRIPGSFFPPARNVYRVRFLDPEQPSPEDDPRDLGDRIRRRMARELKDLDVGTVWDIARPPAHD